MILPVYTCKGRLLIKGSFLGSLECPFYTGLIVNNNNNNKKCTFEWTLI